MRRATLDALLNANYLRKLLEPHYEIAYHAPSMHECVFSHASTGAIAKRLIDYGFHPYTVSFPLIVHGAMMIEPTETESKQELDLFADALVSIAQEVKENPDLVINRTAFDAHNQGRRSGGGAKTDFEVERVNGLLAAGFLIRVDHFLHVPASLVVGRHSLILVDRAFAGVVGGQSLHHVAVVLEEQVPQQPRASVDVLGRIVRISAQRLGRSRHQLHDSQGALGRNCVRPESRFHLSYAGDEFRRKPGAPRGIAHHFSWAKRRRRRGFRFDYGWSDRRDRRRVTTSSSSNPDTRLAGTSVTPPL